MSRLEVADVIFSRRRKAILQDINFAVSSGETLSLLGVNGAGKTTLLRLLLGFLRPDAGSVRLDGRLLPTIRGRERALRMAYVAQVHAIAFPYSVREIVTLGRMPANSMFRRPDETDRAHVDAALERLDIAHLAGRSYAELSGGERQLTMIARALAQDTPVIVLDEPTNGLDYGYQLRLIDHIRSLAAEGRCIIMSTHHPEHALWAASRVILLQGSRITADGTPQDVLTPRTIRQLYGVSVARVAGADGRATFLPL